MALTLSDDETGIPEAVDLRFSLYETVYLQEGVSYAICGHLLKAEETGLHNIMLAGKALGSGLIQLQTVYVSPEEDEAQ